MSATVAHDRTIHRRGWPSRPLAGDTTPESVGYLVRWTFRPPPRDRHDAVGGGYPPAQKRGERRGLAHVERRAHHGQCLWIVGQFGAVEVERQPTAGGYGVVHGVQRTGQRRVVEERRESQ